MLKKSFSKKAKISPQKSHWIFLPTKFVAENALGQLHTGYTRRVGSTTYWVHQTGWVNYILGTLDGQGQPHTGYTRRIGSITYWVHQTGWVTHILATLDGLVQVKTRLVFLYRFGPQRLQYFLNKSTFRVSQKTWEFSDEFDIVFVMNQHCNT